MAAFAAAGAILALSEQRSAVRRQMFVTTLVGMLDRLQQTVQDTDYFVLEATPLENGLIDERAVASQTGQSAFYEISQELRLYITENFMPEMSDHAKMGLMILLYRGFYEDYKDSLGHFFRQLYHIVKYIDESGEDECERFIKIVRASLTNAQLSLLSYNSISGEGRIKFSKYITKYSLLHNLAFERDELGKVERLLIIDRLGLSALVSKTEINDRLDAEYIATEGSNTASLEAFRRFLNERGLSVNYGIAWHN